MANVDDARPERTAASIRTPQELFKAFAPGVAYVEVQDIETGDPGIGTAFHVGNGIFVTAAHVLRGKTLKSIVTTMETTERRPDGWSHPLYQARAAKHSETFFHPDSNVDVACIKTDLLAAHLSLSLHTDILFDGASFVLEPVIVMGYPTVSQCAEPLLVCTRGEVNGCFVPYVGAPRPHFLISSVARGGFSGGPAILVATGECIGIVTSSFLMDGQTTEQGYLTVLAVESMVETLRHHALLPEEQGHVTELYEMLDLAKELRDEREGKTPRKERPPTYIVSAWNGSNHRCAFHAGRSLDDAILRADELAAEHEEGPWTVFRVYSSEDDDQGSLHTAMVKNPRPVAIGSRAAKSRG